VLAGLGHLVQADVLAQPPRAFERVGSQRLTPVEVPEHLLAPGRCQRLVDLVEHDTARTRTAPDRDHAEGDGLDTLQRIEPLLVESIEPRALVGVAQPGRHVVLGVGELALHHPAVAAATVEPGPDPLVAILAGQVQPVGQQHRGATRSEYGGQAGD